MIDIHAYCINDNRKEFYKLLRSKNGAAILYWCYIGSEAWHEDIPGSFHLPELTSRSPIQCAVWCFPYMEGDLDVKDP